MEERIIRLFVVPMWLTSVLCWAGWMCVHEVFSVVRGE